jgi:phosphatidate cytidylyltransferase
MSPGEALQSEVFRRYAALILGLLAAAGLLLFLLGRLTRKDLRAVWTTYKSWLILAPLVLGAVFAGRWAAVGLFTLVSLLGIKEFSRATGLYRDWWFMTAVYAGCIAIGVLSLVEDPGTGQPGWYGLFMALPVYEIGALLLIPILRNRTSGQLQLLALAILGFIYIGWMFGHLAFLASSRHAYGYLLFLILAVEVNDVAAFTFGRLLGRHPLRSNISPNKTWEGSLGAFAVSMALPWLLAFSFPHFGALQLILTGLIVGIGGQLGDLAVSVIKRDIGIKDMGRLIPGHGGVLDRIDSLIFTAPLFFHMIRYFDGIH